MQQNEEPMVDPEEQEEGKLVHYMALAVVAAVAGGVLFLALRPWIQSLRKEQTDQDGSDSLPDNGAAEVQSTAENGAE